MRYGYVDAKQRASVANNLVMLWFICQSSERSERYKQRSNALTYLSKRYKRYNRYTFLSKILEGNALFVKAARRAATKRYKRYK